jgi:predicted neuraminidase
VKPDADLEPVADGIVRADADEQRVSRAFLPSSTVQTHAANVRVMPNGDVLCVWFGGTQEGVSDIDIWSSRLAVGSTRWSPAERLSHDPERSEQNPVLFRTPRGELWLLWTAQRSGHQNTAEVRRRVSTDEGRSWGPQRTIFRPDDSGGFFVRHPPVFPDDNTWVLPIFRCPVVPGQVWTGNLDSSSVMVTRDDGANWEEIPVPDSTGSVHMSIVPAASGWQAFFRSRWADAIYRSTSADTLAWSAPSPTSLPNNNSSIQAVPVSDTADGVALVFNDSSAADAVGRRTSLYDEIDDAGLIGTPSLNTDTAPGTDSTPNDDSSPLGSESGSEHRAAFWGAPRAPLSLALSPDGDRWPLVVDVAIGDGYCMTNDSRSGANRELSYPSVARSPDGALHIAFTYHRRAIRYVRIDAELVRELVDRLPEHLD